MLGKPPSRDAVLKNVRKALDETKFKYESHEDGAIALSAMGDDLPIGMVIDVDGDRYTLNIYCYLMFPIEPDTEERIVMELNKLNNTINNGAFVYLEELKQICFKVTQSYYDKAPSVDLIKHLMTISFQTVDENDGNLKALMPEAPVPDHMYS